MNYGSDTQIQICWKAWGYGLYGWYSFIRAMGMVGVHLITAGEGILPGFYEKFGFKNEDEIILM